MHNEEIVIFSTGYGGVGSSLYIQVNVPWAALTSFFIFLIWLARVLGINEVESLSMDLVNNRPTRSTSYFPPINSDCCSLNLLLKLINLRFSWLFLLFLLNRRRRRYYLAMLRSHDLNWRFCHLRMLNSNMRNITKSARLWLNIRCRNKLFVFKR